MSNLDYLRTLGIIYDADYDKSEIYLRVEYLIKTYLNSNPREILVGDGTKNTYSLFFSLIFLAVKNKKLNPNTLLSMAVKHTRNYIGILLIGLLIRAGANPNIYYETQDFGTIHILGKAANRVEGPDPMFRYIIMTLRILGSDINYPLSQNKRIDGLIDTTFIETLKPENKNISVADYIRKEGKIPDEDKEMFFDSLTESDKLHMYIATDDFNNIIKDEYLTSIKDNIETSAEFLNEVSTGYCNKIWENLNEENFPKINELYNGQILPLYIASKSLNSDMFYNYIQRGFMVKYFTVNSLAISYKYFEKEKVLGIPKLAYSMLLDAINVGAYMDKYQFNMITLGASYDEIVKLQESYSVPQWEKLCSVKELNQKSNSEKTREDLVQIAFDLNLDYTLSEEKLCSKIRKISMMKKEDFLDVIIKKQMNKIDADISSTDGRDGKDRWENGNIFNREKYRCNLKSTVLKNPYLYNDTKMAFYRSPKDGEVYCFTSDIFDQLISTKKNPYNDEDLPIKFYNTIKTQINILRELDIINDDSSIENSYEKIFSSSEINNDKTDYSYNTVVAILENYGVSKLRFDTLGLLVQTDTILQGICGIVVERFDTLLPVHRKVTVARAIYSLAKNKDLYPRPEKLFEEIASTLGTNFYGESEEGSLYDNSLLRENPNAYIPPEQKRENKIEEDDNDFP